MKKLVSQLSELLFDKLGVSPILIKVLLIILGVILAVLFLRWAQRSLILRARIILAKTGDREEQENLARYYYRKKTPRDYRKSLKWCLMAAENGSTWIIPIIGNIYYYGQGVCVDKKEALKWYLQAAEEGSCLGQFQCGYIYRNGEGGVPKNDHEGFKWYHLAAQQGDAKAQLQLACCYIEGAGVNRDIDKAKEWLKKAEQQGNESAAELLRKISCVKF